jgi:hypothetical protein
VKSHDFKPIHFSDGQHGGRCTCGWAPLRDRNKQVIEDALYVHQQNVQRALAGLRRSASTGTVLKSERDWYRLQADNTSNSKEERELWAKLADELDGRLNDADGTDDEQLSIDGLL